MRLEVLVYCPLMEDEEQQIKGWDKSTVDYVTQNKSRVIRTIRNTARTFRDRRLQIPEIEDIYSDVLLYLYQSEDYNISKAIERSSDGTVVPLEGYINSCVRFCTMRNITTAYKIEKKTITKNVTINNEGTELSIFDKVSDKESGLAFEGLDNNLEQCCRTYEHMRYKYGPDLFLVWYIRLLTEGMDTVYIDILSILGITKKELKAMERESFKDGIMADFAGVIAVLGGEESIKILEGYVYGAFHIRRVIEDICDGAVLN